MVILGHLAPKLEVKPGDILPEDGATIGVIGDPTVNGGCDPHLHLQIMTRERYDQLVDIDLDGYGRENELEALKRGYLDPLAAMLWLTANQK